MLITRVHLCIPHTPYKRAEIDQAEERVMIHVPCYPKYRPIRGRGKSGKINRKKKEEEKGERRMYLVLFN
jgi:hypothetical protein